jgi:hypothetical protein
MIINIEQRRLEREAIRLEQEALRLANRTAEEVIEDNIIEAKQWRNNELKNTDWIVPITDHSEHQIYLDYRQLLRDWTDTDNFPDTKPEKQ